MFVAVEAGSEGLAIWDRFGSDQRLVVNFTLTCNLACAHCIVESSPHRKERLAVAAVRETLVMWRARGKDHVTLSGGEVFLYPTQLVEIVAFASQLGFVVDVESNGFWARSDEIARRRLEPMVRAGLSGLVLSSDAYHSAFFSVERVIRAARVGRALGLCTEISFCRSDQREVDQQIRDALSAAGEAWVENELLDRGRGSDLADIVAGRDIDELQDCDSLTTTVHATGDVYACCELETSSDEMKRTPVYLGSIEATAADPAGAQARERLVTEFHRPESPAYFRRLLTESPAFRPLRSQRFKSICDFCLTALADEERVEVVRRRLPKRAGEGDA